MTRPSKPLIQGVPGLSAWNPTVAGYSVVIALTSTFIAALVLLLGGQPWVGFQIIALLSAGVAWRQFWLDENPTRVVGGHAPEQERIP